MNQENQLDHGNSTAPRDGSKSKNIGALLTKLSLHYPPQESFSVILDDMVSDLEQFTVHEIQLACSAWRTSAEKWMPTSGQLIAKIHLAREASIMRARGSQTFRTPLIEPDRKWAYELEPWRDILRRNGRPIPDDDSPMAISLDALQTPPQWASSREA